MSMLQHDDAISTFIFFLRCVSERLQCFNDGEFSLVNVTYDDYLAVLSGREFTASGRVVVCLNGVYSSVCDVDWDQNDADVFCNSGITGIQTNFGEGMLSRINCLSTDNRPACYFV